MKFDAYGIPVLGSGDIETLAEQFLQGWAPEVLKEPTFTPIASILNSLQEQGRLRLELWANLGKSPKGHQYLGWYVPSQRLIRIAISTDDPRFPFTIAHELAHFLLHSRVTPSALESHTQIEDTARHIVIHRIDSSKPRSLIEWQANRFAAAILISRRTIRTAVIAIQQNLGVNRNLGTIRVDEQRCNQIDYRAIEASLSELYQTSRSVVRYRLRDLGILERVDSFRRGSSFARFGEW